MAHPAHASAALSAAGHPARTIFGSAHVGTPGTRSTPAVSARPAFTSGPQHSASCAAAGRNIHSGMGSEQLWMENGSLQIGSDRVTASHLHRNQGNKYNHAQAGARVIFPSDGCKAQSLVSARAVIEPSYQLSYRAVELPCKQEQCTGCSRFFRGERLILGPRRTRKAGARTRRAHVRPAFQKR